MTKEGCLEKYKPCTGPVFDSAPAKWNQVEVCFCRVKA